MRRSTFLKWKTLFPQSATQHQRQNPNPLTTPRSPAFPFHLWDWFKLQDEHSGWDPHSALSSATHRGVRHPLWGCPQLRASFHKNWTSLSPAMHQAGICSGAFSGHQTGDSVVCRTAKCSQSQPNAARATSFLAVPSFLGHHFLTLGLCFLWVFIIDATSAPAHTLAFFHRAWLSSRPQIEQPKCPCSGFLSSHLLQDE